MILRTEIEPTPLVERITHADQIFTIGSCFAQNIGERLLRSKFNTTINPTGVLFNPLSICATLERLHQRKPIEQQELREGALGWYHLDFHSSLNGRSREEALDNINSAVERGSEALAKADWVILTLGTAWLYERADTAELVANCHREPARNFLRRRASLNEIVERLSEMIETTLCDKRVILTLSPIRHVADGLEENSLSKATLRLAIDEVVNRAPERVYYLPAYEIMMDDLRDDRFYDDDLVHPSSMAIEYIWQYFCMVALSNESQELLPRIERVIKASQHRPTNPASESHRAFCQAQIQAIEALSGVEMSQERVYFESLLR